MNKLTYEVIRRSVRDNGLHYTTHHATLTNNISTLEVCDHLYNLMRVTDWLAMRQLFVRTGEKPSIAFKLTTPLLERR